eukprot:TRINITY_DN871_c2_g1_i1.p1 TRINITY_DN871_c2_g1~~TRINITY_DN871_c2_g1_i1.p1  ORF type:complete len:372 (-),score=113.39 TRINITY_DN871_c2_g1_i1:86-1201(-)
MASRQKTVHSMNPTSLIENILKQKIHRSPYWKEYCFALTSATLTERAMEIRCFGGTYGGNKKPCDFMCLLLAMLQIQPEHDIVVEYIKNDDYIYVRLLGAVYMRLTGKAIDIFQYLEPLYYDYRKCYYRTSTGFEIVHVDEVIDILLTTDYYLEISLPYLQKRWVLEEQGILQPRQTLIQEEFEEYLEEENKKAELDRLETENKIKQLRKNKNKKRDYSSDEDDFSDNDKDYDRHHSRDRHRSSRHSSSSSRHRDRDRDRHNSSRHSSRSSRHRDRDNDRHSSSRHKRKSRYDDDDDYYDSHKKSKKKYYYSSKKKNKYSNDDDDYYSEDEDLKDKRKPKKQKTGNEESLSIEETNKIRQSLGLPLLKVKK